MRSWAAPTPSSASRQERCAARREPAGRDGGGGMARVARAGKGSAMAMARSRERRERAELESVGALVSQVLRRFGLDRRLAEHRALDAWSEVVGPSIAGQSRAAGIRDGVLFVDVASNVWMQELGLLRE